MPYQDQDQMPCQDQDQMPHQDLLPHHYSHNTCPHIGARWQTMLQACESERYHSTISRRYLLKPLK